MRKHKETREEKADRFKQESGKEFHTSDCSTSIAPAEEPGPCDCDADDPATGWINMVMGWARINHLESDTVISALCRAKDFLAADKARVRELEAELETAKDFLSNISVERDNAEVHASELEQQLKEQNVEIGRLNSCKTTYDTNLSTLASNHAIQIRELTNEARQAHADGRKAGLEDAACYIEKANDVEDRIRIAEDIRALANSETGMSAYYGQVDVMIARCRWTTKPMESCDCGDCKTNKVKPGEWIQPVRKGYRMECCDCGLVHRLNFRIRKGKTQFQAFREDQP